MLPRQRHRYFRLHLQAAIPPLFVGIGANSDQELAVGSYASLLPKLDDLPAVLPPIAYSFPLTTVEARCCLEVGIGAFSVQVSVRGSYASLTFSGPELVPPTA